MLCQVYDDARLCAPVTPVHSLVGRSAQTYSALHRTAQHAQHSTAQHATLSFQLPLECLNVRIRETHVDFERGIGRVLG